MESAKSMIHSNNLPLRLWAEAINTAVYLINRTINKQTGDITPFEAWFQQKPSVSHYRVFGSLAYVYINKQVRTKLQLKSKLMIFIDYSSTSRAYRFWNPFDDSVVESSDARFDEAAGRFDPNTFPHYKPSSNIYLNLETISDNTIDSQTIGDIGFPLNLQSPASAQLPMPHPSSEDITEVSSSSLEDISSQPSLQLIADVETEIISDLETVTPVGVFGHMSNARDSSTPQSEPIRPRFRSMTDLLDNTIRQPGYSITDQNFGTPESSANLTFCSSQPSADDAAIFKIETQVYLTKRNRHVLLLYSLLWVKFLRNLKLIFKQ